MTVRDTFMFSQEHRGRTHLTISVLVMSANIQVAATGNYLPSLKLAEIGIVTRTVASIAVLPGACATVDPVCANGVTIVSTVSA